MKQIGRLIKPQRGFGRLVHSVGLILLPAILYILARVGFTELSVAVILLSKWRIFAVRARYWPAHLRSNSIDISVGLSVVLLMSSTNSMLSHLLLAALYVIWLVVIKPRSSLVWVSMQALIGQTISLYTVFHIWGEHSVLFLVAATALICVLAARHFLSSFDENMSRMIAYTWGYVTAAIVWLSTHWLIYFGTIAQPVLLISVMGYGTATLYYLDHKSALSKHVLRQVVITICALAFVIIMFSGRSDNIVL
ncbi:hypothetical protein IPO96_00680 [Candidatus Saccharibacteria bacterium]|jgi:hypothetical protein|nr:MAG: hypothetical protein IPO96_00680 [Candidatus Saccharibacteria bacterium]